MKKGRNLRGRIRGQNLMIIVVGLAILAVYLARAVRLTTSSSPSSPHKAQHRENPDFIVSSQADPPKKAGKPPYAMQTVTWKGQRSN